MTRRTDRNEASAAIAGYMPDGNCAGFNDAWDDYDRTYQASASNPTKRQEIHALAVSHCQGCAATSECASLATIGLYTGFAAGAHYVNGRPQAAPSSAGKAIA